MKEYGLSYKALSESGCDRSDPPVSTPFFQTRLAALQRSDVKFVCHRTEATRDQWGTASITR